MYKNTSSSSVVFGSEQGNGREEFIKHGMEDWGFFVVRLRLGVRGGVNMLANGC